MNKRILSLILVLLFSVGMVAGCGNTARTAGGETPDEVSDENAENEAADRIRIGVALWSSTDVLGSRCKEIICEAADALDVDVCFSDHGYDDHRITASVDELIKDGCEGIVICNSTDEQMDGVLDACDASGVYLAQCFRTINRVSSPKVFKKAEASAFYVGCVHENEIEAGRNTAQMILNLRDKEIGVIGWVPDDSAWLSRQEGYRIAVDGTNVINPDNKVKLLDPVYAGITFDGGYEAAEELMSREKNLDAIIVSGGGGEPLAGVLSAINKAGMGAKIDVVATDFVDDLDERMKNGTMVGASGGTFCDPLLAFMMVYNSVRGADGYTDLSGEYNEIVFPYLYAVSPQDFADFEKEFTDSLPYSREEFIELSQLNMDELQKEATGFKKKW